MPRLNLEGSSSIITGGASGIGAGIATRMRAEGAKVKSLRRSTPVMVVTQ